MNTNLKILLENANANITTCNVTEAKENLDNKNYVFIDVRDQVELKGEEVIPNAINISRGMLEFNLDPNSPYYNEVFSEEKIFVFFCKKGARSALATKTAKEMGLKNAINMTGGLQEWDKHFSQKKSTKYI